MKVILVTGSARRIGAQIIKTFHQQGYKCLIHYRSSVEAAKQLSDELNAQRPDSAHILQADLAKITDIKKLAQEAMAVWGKIDVLVNNASSFYPTALGDDISENNWNDLFSSNAQAPLFLANSLYPHLKAQQGCIVNLTDIHAKTPLKSHTIYCMAKAALLMMTQSLAKEMAPEVRVNAVSPGAILWPEQALSDKEKHNVLSEIALQRMGSAIDIASTIYFLAEQAPYVTGQIIAVDGGRSLGRHALA